MIAMLQDAALYFNVLRSVVLWRQLLTIMIWGTIFIKTNAAKAKGWPKILMLIRMLMLMCYHFECKQFVKIKHKKSFHLVPVLLLLWLFASADNNLQRVRSDAEERSGYKEMNCCPLQCRNGGGILRQKRHLRTTSASASSSTTSILANNTPKW